MMEVTSAVKPSPGSAFSIDSIMSRGRSSGGGEPREDRVVSREAERERPVSSSASASSSRHGSPVAAVQVQVSNAGPASSAAASLTLPGHGHLHSPPGGSTLPEALHPHAHAHHPALTLTRSVPGTSLHHPAAHLPSLAVSATEAAIMQHNRAALAAAASAQHTLQTQQAQAQAQAVQAQAAAMAAVGLSAAGLDPHGAGTTTALTAGGVGTIPALPSFSSLTHHHHPTPDRGLAALQALSHKIQGGLPPALGGGLPGGGAGFPGGGAPPGGGGTPHLPPHHHHHPGLGNGLAGLAPKHVLPFYSWFSRPGGYWAHRLPGKNAVCDADAGDGNGTRRKPVEILRPSSHRTPEQICPPICRQIL